MLAHIMIFIDRQDVLRRLEALSRARDGGLAVVYGRRRVGKTRLLLEWVRRRKGSYFVADQSAPAVQRRYLAKALAARLPGFDAVEYPDWRALLDRLSSDAKARGFKGPLVIDELPYLVAASPELPSVLQAFIDHGAREAKLVVALAGSSQRMMQGLVLDASAPLYGRARETLALEPLAPEFLPRAFPRLKGRGLLAAWTAWGGVPRYWELAAALRGSTEERLDRLALDPGGPLHHEPDRLLLEELPPAADLRPLLDAIGSGAHRLSEIAGRIGRPATSLSRPLERLLGLGLVVREVPYGEPERGTKRSLYRIADPFIRLWFRVVAPHRGFLAAATAAERKALLSRHFPALTSEAWEELVRARIGGLGGWKPAGRWWQGGAPEWDVVSTSPDGRQLLLGECKAVDRPIGLGALTAEARRLVMRPAPPVATASEIVRALCVPEVARGVPAELEGVRIVTLARLLGA